MRHARVGDMAPLHDLIAALRLLEGLGERKPGIFYRKSRAFLHFHVDGEQLFADARLNEEFERWRVTTTTEQTIFLDAVKNAVASPASRTARTREER